MDPKFLTDGKFDIDKFNNAFVQTVNSQKEQAFAEDDRQLKLLNENLKKVESVLHALSHPFADWEFDGETIFK